MDSEDWIILGAVAVGAYLIYKSFRITDITKENLIAAGFTNEGKSKMNGKDLLGYQKWNGGGGVIAFSGTDYSKLNVAQDLLVRADQFVPGTWLSRMVLGA